MRKGRLAAIGSLFLLMSVVHCSIPDLPSEGGRCPCAPGYSCDRDTQICVRDGATSTSASTGGGTGTTSNTGGSGPGGAGGAGGSGTGGDGVGACGGSNPWSEDAGGIDYANYNCPDASPACEVLPNHLLCCDNKSFVTGFATPSDGSDTEGTLDSAHSYFVCWLRGQESGGNTVWYYTSLDHPPGSWGFVEGRYLMPGSSGFDVTDPSGTGLPECPCQLRGTP